MFSQEFFKRELLEEWGQQSKELSQKEKDDLPLLLTYVWKAQYQEKDSRFFRAKIEVTNELSNYVVSQFVNKHDDIINGCPRSGTKVSLCRREASLAWKRLNPPD